MKKNWVPLLLAVLLGWGGVLSVSAQESRIPFYHSQLDFLLTTPGAEGSAIGGYANPAVFGMLPGRELQFFWSDEKAQFKSLKRWGIFTGIPHLGFGVVYNKLPISNGEGYTYSGGVTDYRIALALGNRASSFGVGYGWSKGERTSRIRDDIFTVGLVQRPWQFVSLGITRTFATRYSDKSGLADLAVRPLGNPMLTLFGDAEMQKKDRLKDVRWGVGMAVEPLPGVQLVGKYLDTESFTLGLTVSLGRKGLSSVAHFDKKEKLDYATYGVRTGYPINNVIDRYLKNRKNYLSMELKGQISYQKYRFFDKDTHTLSDILFALDDAIKDQKIAGVALNLSGMEISRVMAWEIRKKLEDVKKANKKVVAFIDMAEMREYHLASVADRIVMDPQGIIVIPGYASGRTFYRSMLDKIGIGFDEWRFFKYKSAAEPFSRDSMSAPDREQRRALVDDFYALVREDVASSRHVSLEKFDFWVNQNFFFLPESALAQGLVDTLGRWDDMKDIIKSLEGKGKKMVGANQLAKQEFPSQIWGERPKIAIVYALGPCAMDYGIKARQLEKIFRSLKEDKQVKAVVFRVDSPGGEGRASDVVAEALRKCAEKKPVIVSQGNLAGSGGYWISMYGDTIVAAPNTLTGSIGVIGGWFYNKGIGSKLGLNYDQVKVGDHADLGYGIVLPFLGWEIPDRNVTAEERDLIKSAIHVVYQDFVDRVAKGRRMTPSAVDSVGQGRVWSGQDGKEKGLVDVIGGLETAIALAKQSAKIPPEKKVEIVELPQKGLFKLDLFQPKIPGFNMEEDRFWQYLKMISEHPGEPIPMLPPDLCPNE